MFRPCESDEETRRWRVVEKRRVHPKYEEKGIEGVLFFYSCFALRETKRAVRYIGYRILVRK